MPRGHTSHSMFDDLLLQIHRMPWFHYAAGSSLLILSLTGIFTNLVFFVFTVRRPKFSYAFYRFCRTKALANVIMALSYLLWPTVCCFLGYLYLPNSYNIFIGQFAGIGIYIVGPIAQLFVAINRTMATCFPIYFAKSGYGGHITWLSIVAAFAIGTGFFFMGMSDGCAFVFNMDLLSWMIQDAPCAIYNIYFLLYTIIALFGAACVFNLCTFVQIMRITRKINGSSRHAVAQERKNRNLFIQNIILDSFVLIDMIMVTFAAGWSDAVWYQFLINSILWILHINADGAVMFFYNVQWRKSKALLATKSDPTPLRTNAPPSIIRFQGLLLEFFDWLIVLWLTMNATIGIEERLIAGGLLLFFSVTGVLSNLIFITFTVGNPQFKHAFYTFCRAKAFANCIMAATHLFWSTFCTFLAKYFLPQSFNIFFGQFAGWGIYIIGPILQLAITGNRFIVTFFPVQFTNSTHDGLLTWTVIFFSGIIGVVYFFLGFRDGCAFVYILESISWLPQDNPCAWDRAYFLLYSVSALFIASSCLNICIFVQLMTITKKMAVAREHVIAREKRNKQLFVQAIILDSFFLVDVLAATFAIKWCEAIWYQFMINSLLWLWHVNADGIVMLIYCRQIRNSTKVCNNAPTRNVEKAAIAVN